MHLLRLGLLTLTLALGLPCAQAQAPHALNAPPLPAAFAARLLVPEVLLGRVGGSPDTTSAWRYYPLHIGNAWEYTTFDGSTVYRREINRDTTINGRHYAVIDHFVSEDGGPLEPGQDPSKNYRFDTLSALVYEPNGAGGERVPFQVPCPFDADFDTTAMCPGFGSRDFTVTGGYEGLLVFGGTTPGTGTDTVRTAYKEYTFETLTWTYAADFGEAFHDSKMEAPYGLYFARIDGVEYGPEQYPVGMEPPGPDGGELSLRVWPNPSHGQVSASFALERPEVVVLEVYDAIGRRVRRKELGLLPAGRHEVALDLAGLAAGPYVLRLQAGTGHTVRIVARIE